MISTPKSQRQADLYEFKARMVYRESSRTAKTNKQANHLWGQVRLYGWMEKIGVLLW